MNLFAHASSESHRNRFTERDDLFDLLSRRTKALIILSIVAFFAVVIYVETNHLNPLITRAVGDDYKIEKLYITDGKIIVFSPYFYGARIWPRYQRGLPNAGVEVMIEYPDTTGKLRYTKELWSITTIEKHAVGDAVPIAMLEYDNRPGSPYPHYNTLKTIVAQYSDGESERLLPAQEREKLGRVRECVGKYAAHVAEARTVNRKRRSGSQVGRYDSYRKEWEAANPDRIPTNVLVARGDFAPGGKYGYNAARKITQRDAK